jgi:hypothetical protein
MALIYREGTPALLQERETLEVEVWREIMDSNLDQKNFWDEQSCREFEAMLDAREPDEAAYARWVAQKEAMSVDSHNRPE